MKCLKKITTGVLLSGLVFTACQDEKVENEIVESIVAPSEIEGEIIKDSYIVVMDPKKIEPINARFSGKSFTSRESKSKEARILEVEAIKKINSTLSLSSLDKSKISGYYSTYFPGIAVENVSKEELISLSKTPGVKEIHYNQLIPNPMDSSFVEDEAKDMTSKMAQEIPCGIERAGGFVNSEQAKTWIWIIDTGIDLDHPDLNVVTDSRYAKSYVGGSPDDCNGHGTHVAGTAAAINNGTGVVGVSAGAPVVPLRVFGCSGGASTSAILSAINHVGQNDLPGDSVNLSLGGFFGSGCASRSPYASALQALGNQGTFVAIAAGNSGADTTSYAPGCVNGNNIYTVASMTCNYRFSSFSNYNTAAVDVIATGSSVLSTWPGGRYRTISGTSMASPHVAGILHARKGAPLSAGNLTNRGQAYPVAIVK